MSDQTPIIDASFQGTVGGFALDVAFKAPASGVTGLFGPSGCGKTTLLRCVAGLERLAGKLIVADDVWQDDAADIFKKTYERPIGYVFQEANLFPHLSVRKNILFGAHRAERAGADQFFKLDEVVDLLSLRAMLDRSPAALSGGERQRVAMGRALMSQPRLLLLDEPLSALDRPSKEEIFPYLETLHETLSIPSLYVSHDISELERLADTLVLLESGHVVACGALPRLQADPSLPLMRAPDAAVTITGRVTEIDAPYGLARLAVDGGKLTMPAREAKVGEERRLRIKASDISFARVRADQTSILNCLPAKIMSIETQPDDPNHVNIVAAFGEDGAGARIVGRITRKSKETLDLSPDRAVYAQIKSIALV